MQWWWLDTGWACGGVATNERGIIVEGAPIFRKLRGQYLALMRYKKVRI